MLCGRLFPQSFIVSPKNREARVVGCIKIVSFRNPPADRFQIFKCPCIPRRISVAGKIISTPNVHKYWAPAIFLGPVNKVDTCTPDGGDFNLLARGSTIENGQKSSYSTLGNCLINYVRFRDSGSGA